MSGLSANRSTTRCIDPAVIQRLWSIPMSVAKDPGQRPHCGCAVSKDIGVNDTCLHGCRYCYATVDHALAQRRHAEHDPHAEALWGHPEGPLGRRERGQGRLCG
ncbi:MAG: DUF1848 family protein [Chloroflexi bacterium]|nr:DUF1848 family protein [Chloroflexota bacterium]